MPEIDYLSNDSIIPENQRYSVMSLFMDDNKEIDRNLAIEWCKQNINDAKEVWFFISGNYISDGMMIELQYAIKFNKIIRFFSYELGTIKEIL